CQRVGRNDHAHADPQCSDIPCRPGAFFDGGGSEIVIPERALGNIALEFDEFDLCGHTVPRLRNLPSPALALNSPFSMITLPRDKTISVTPRTFRPSYAL